MGSNSSRPTATNSDRFGPSTILAFQPSTGFGGGIERYCEWLLTALEEGGVHVEQAALLHEGESPSIVRKLKFVFTAFRMARRVRSNAPTGVLICHPDLAVPIVIMLRAARLHSSERHVLFYGIDIWSVGPIRAMVFRRLNVRLLTVSAFSAGALTMVGPSNVLSPGLRRDWYACLTDTSRLQRSTPSDPMQVLTVFRFDSARDKGLPQLLDAIDQVRSSHACSLTISGSGALPADLRERIARLPWVSVVSKPSDAVLARLYADSDVFVLATRTRVLPTASGEGFGLVLIEAQLTGTPVVAPAHGGSDDAFIPGVTGLKPSDESASRLAEVLTHLAFDTDNRVRLGQNAKAWSQAAFDPDRRSRQVQTVILGAPGLSRDHALPIALTQSGTIFDSGSET